MKKIHKITGLLLLLFMIWMAFSGVILNHRHVFADLEINRNKLPDSYAYSNWNYGFFKGSLNISSDSVLLYGNEGVWLTNENHTSVSEFNKGIRKGADNRKVCRVISTSTKEYYCLTLFHLYKYDKDSKKWNLLSLPKITNRFTDIEVHNDTIVALTRSEFIIKYPDRTDFQLQPIANSPDLSPKRSLFRLIWTLHSGELFGTVGKIIVDAMAILFCFLSITGLLIYLLPKVIRWKKKREYAASGSVSSFRFSWKWHNKVGYWMIIPLLIVVITGSFLRPPLLLFISRPKVVPPPFTTMSSENTWHDLLRAIRYDKEQKEWILYASEGFFRFPRLDQPPRLLSHQAPVSVMGITVWEQLDDSWWLIGSFNGLLVWNPIDGIIIDAFTKRPYVSSSGMPFGQHKVSGFTFAFKEKQIFFDYDQGAIALDTEINFPAMPIEYASRPISLWNLALEMHTGRIFTLLGIWSILYPFVLGLLSILMLISGWIVYRRIRNRKKPLSKV